MLPAPVLHDCCRVSTRLREPMRRSLQDSGAQHVLWLLAFGATSGAAFLCWALAAGWDVLAFPQQKRRRHQPLREQLPAGADELGAIYNRPAAMLPHLMNRTCGSKGWGRHLRRCTADGAWGTNPRLATLLSSGPSSQRPRRRLASRCSRRSWRAAPSCGVRSAALRRWPPGDPPPPPACCCASCGTQVR